MTKFGVRNQAPENSRYHPNAFDHQIGKFISLRLPNDEQVSARMLSADVEPGGAFVVLEFESDLPDHIVELIKTGKMIEKDQ